VLAILALQKQSADVVGSSSTTTTNSVSGSNSKPPSARVQSSSNVLYIDLDIHHGDGVEAAFSLDPTVRLLYSWGQQYQWSF